MKISLKYYTITGGTYNGCPALLLSKGTKEYSEIEVLNAIREAESSFNIKNKLLVIDYLLEHSLEEVTFIKDVIYSLPDWTKIGSLIEGLIPPFMPYLTYVRVLITGNNWHKHLAHEIYYTPAGNLIEPDVGSLNTSSSKYILVDDKSFSLGMKFLQIVSTLWGICYVPKKTIEVKIL